MVYGFTPQLAFKPVTRPSFSCPINYFHNKFFALTQSLQDSEFERVQTKIDALRLLLNYNTTLHYAEGLVVRVTAGAYLMGITLQQQARSCFQFLHV